MAGNRRRVYIQLGVAYDSNLEQVKELLDEVLETDDRILKKPGAVVQYQQFSESAIDLKLYFWVRDYREALAVKSDMIMVITDLFRKNLIKIPFPQHEVYVQNLEDVGKKDKPVK